MAGINRRDKNNKPPFNLSVEDAETQTKGTIWSGITSGAASEHE